MKLIPAAFEQEMDCLANEEDLIHTASNTMPSAELSEPLLAAAES